MWDVACMIKLTNCTTDLALLLLSPVIIVSPACQLQCSVLVSGTDCDVFSFQVCGT